MKQLKFMLAAATAVGLAAAAQATDYNSTNFEDDPVGDFPGVNSTWVAEDAGDNTSQIVADTSMQNLASTKYTEKYGKDSAHTKSLKVETGTKPILRYLKETQGTPESVSDVYIDTLVQFTVTPDGEEPVPGAEDKLMLYAKQVGEGGSATTNLFVIASQVSYNAIKGYSHQTNHIDTGVVVENDIWYRLTVTANSVDGEKGQKLNLFKIKLDGVDLTSGETALSYLAANDFTIFPSIQGATATAGIKAVGFAGEGKVDDLVLTDNDPFTPDSTDFTFVVTWDTGISAVEYTIGSTTTQVPENGTFTVPQGATVELAVTLVDSEWTKLADGTVLKFENVAADKEDIDLKTVSVSAEDLGVTVPEGTSDETVNAALAWAKDAGKTPADVEDAGAHFFNNYLLDVDNLDVKPEIEIVEVDASAKPMTIKAKVTDANGSTYEKVIIGDDAVTIKGSIKYRAAATLEAFKDATLKEAIGEDDKFVQVVVE